VSVKALITGGGDGLIARVRKYLDPQARLCVDAVVDTAYQQPIPVTFASGGASVPMMLSLYYSASVGAIVAGQFKRALTYYVPSGYTGYVIRYSSFQAEAATSRVVTERNLGSLNIITNVFTAAAAGQSYVAPRWSGLVEAEVTQAIGAASNIVVTLGYTNDLGVSGRTATIDIPKSSIVGSRWDPVLQAGDLGIQSIQSASTAPTSTSGAVKFLGFTQLGYHEDAGTEAYETLFAPGAITFSEGTVIGIEHQGGTVSKNRRFDVLIQLTEVV
jgi:hypothetical protein